ncbi:unnamed protein product [Prorocentrum cordatum]|uniref:Uncharacterized protein n=1 Tax=Prorocentrum cordatum TaxID=2364126 RepID=A0ABN9U022_9DINO|nr:unnamed protein product [Polarella glacialis]
MMALARRQRRGAGAGGPRGGEENDVTTSDEAAAPPAPLLLLWAGPAALRAAASALSASHIRLPPLETRGAGEGDCRRAAHARLASSPGSPPQTEERPSRRTRASPFRRRRAEGRSEAGLPRRRRGGSEAHATDSCPPWARRRHRHARVHACTRALRPPRGVVGAAARPVWGRERAGLDLRGWPTRRQKRHTTSELRVHRRRSGGAYDLCHSLLVRAARRPNRPQPGAEPAGRLPSHKCWRPTSCARCSKRASPGLGG